MNTVYLRQTLSDGKFIELRYEFMQNTDGEELTKLDDVIRKFNKGIDVLMADEKPKPIEEK